MRVTLAEAGDLVVAGTTAGGIHAFSHEGRPIWNTTLGSMLANLDLSADGEVVAAATADHYLHLFDRRGRELWKMRLKDRVSCLSGSATGSLFVVGSAGGNAYLVDRNGKVPWSYRTGGAVTSAAISAKGNYIAVGAADHSVSLLDSRGSLHWKFTAQGPVSATVLTPNGENVLATAADKRIYYFDRSGALLWNPRTGDTPRAVALSADGRTSVIGAGNEVLLIGREGGLIRRWQSQGTVLSVAMATAGEYGAAAASDDSVFFFTRNGEVLWQSRFDDGITSIASSGTGEALAGGGRSKTVVFLDNTVYFRQYLEATRTALVQAKRIGLNTLEADILLQRAEGDLLRKEYASAITYARGIDQLLRRTKEKARPDIAILAVVHDSFVPNQPTKLRSIVFNAGTAHAERVHLEFGGQVEVQGDRDVGPVEINRFREVAYDVVPRAAGVVPFRVLILATDSDGREVQSETTVQINAEAQRTAYPKAFPVVQVGNVQRLVQRVQASKTAKPGSPPAVMPPRPATPAPAAGPGKAAASGAARACPGCGKPIQGMWTHCPYCRTALD